MSVLDRFIDRMHEANVTVLLCGVRPGSDESDRIQRPGAASWTGSVFVFQETGRFWTSTLEAVRFAYEVMATTFAKPAPAMPRASTENKVGHDVDPRPTRAVTLALSSQLRDASNVRQSSPRARRFRQCDDLVLVHQHDRWSYPGCKICMRDNSVRDRK